MTLASYRAKRTAAQNGSAVAMIDITPDDDDDLATPIAGIVADVAGNAVVTFLDGTTDTLALAAKTPVMVGIKKVDATNTTATGIKGFSPAKASAW